MPTLNRNTSPEITIEDLGASFTRADVQLEGLEHSGSSYEGRVYINNPEADPDTPTTPDAGYAGSYYIFGHGGCYGDPGHCDIPSRSPYDPRTPFGLLPTRKVVTATGLIQRALAAHEHVTVTVVPVLLATSPNVREDEVLPTFTAVSVITYQ